MPHELHIIRAAEFIRLGPQGTLDMEESRRLLTALATALVRHGVDRAILDIRKTRMDPPATYTQLYHLARAFQEAGFGPLHRLAVLHPLDKTDRAEFFAICASGRGWNCFAFDSFEEAFDWLSVREDVEEGQPPPAVE